MKKDMHAASPGVRTTPLPKPRGPLSADLFAALRRPPHRLSVSPLRSARQALHDDDLQLSLYCCYELHYQGFSDVDDEWEWNPWLIAVRSELEEAFERELRSALPVYSNAPGKVPDALWELTRGEGFSLSGWLLQHGDRFHAEEIAIHRSGYQLKEADPHTWGIPRLSGRAKAAMVMIQSDEYGGGVAKEMHSSLFADAMSALGLNPAYGAYLSRLPAVTLATTNLISMFGLHRRLRGALIGHLASFEMNSVGPMRRYSSWLESLGVSTEGRRFYDVHIEADAVHQHVAANDLVGGLLDDEPDQSAAVMFGARALAFVESAFASHLVSAWKGDRSSLWTP